MSTDTIKKKQKKTLHFIRAAIFTMLVQKNDVHNKRKKKKTTKL